MLCCTQLFPTKQRIKIHLTLFIGLVISIYFCTSYDERLKDFHDFFYASVVIFPSFHFRLPRDGRMYTIRTCLSFDFFCIFRSLCSSRAGGTKGFEFNIQYNNYFFKFMKIGRATFTMLHKVLRIGMVNIYSAHSPCLKYEF